MLHDALVRDLHIRARNVHAIHKELALTEQLADRLVLQVGRGAHADIQNLSAGFKLLQDLQERTRRRHRRRVTIEERVVGLVVVIVAPKEFHVGHRNVGDETDDARPYDRAKEEQNEKHRRQGGDEEARDHDVLRVHLGHRVSEYVSERPK